jgi:Asp-tRNA(Asn)/Glu-tRNA(Gln) amidotransferase A subunit family amidase
MTDELTWLPAWRLRELIGAREVSVAEVVDHFLDRIERLDPQLHAFLQVDTDGARKVAAEADRMVASGDDLGPLHGIPVSIKAHTAVAGLRRSYGFVDAGTAQYDDIAVERLRQAGAIIVGINTVLGSGGRVAPGPAGSGIMVAEFNWDAEARNPWDLGRVPGWSSSGSASAAAARLVPISLANDGGGSTRLPAAYCGIVGVHPSPGLVPWIDYARPSFMVTATRGPLCRDVRDAAITLQAIAGPDGRDYACDLHEPPDYLEQLDGGAPGMRLAWTDDFGYTRRFAAPETETVIAHVREQAMRLTSLGATVEQIGDTWEDPHRANGPGPGEPRVYTAETSYNTYPMPPVDPSAYHDAMAWRARNWDTFRSVFQRYDLLLSVTAQRVAAPVEEFGAAWSATPDPRNGEGTFAQAYVANAAMCNIAGMPAVSVPCGFVDGLPVGLQIIGWPGSEARILQLAAAFQDAYPYLEHPPAA